MQKATNYRTSEVARALRKSFEACELVAYPDPKTGGAPWTCGWGSTGFDIGPGTVWTQKYADIRYLQDEAQAEALIHKYVTADITQGIFDCMVDIVYNVGPGNARRDGIIRLKDGRPSTLLRRLNEGDYQRAGDAYDDWVSPGSNVENGLKRRRAAFLKFWDKPDES